MRFLHGPRPRLFAHRGGAAEAPENTLEAFRAGLDAGADRLELDVHATADGAVVVIHDETLERTTDDEGPVSQITLADLKRLNAACRFGGGQRCARVPTLDEVLEAFPDVPLNIEIKQDRPPIVRQVLAVLDRHRARDRVLLAASKAHVMNAIREAAPDVLTGFSVLEVVEFMVRLRDPAYRPRGAALQVPPEDSGFTIVTPETVSRAHALGLEVHVWTINEEPEMERLLDLGVDGIMTDRPARAAALYARRGLR